MLYHIWTAGCQMNVADSQRVASELERLGYRPTPVAEQADVVVLNTCVVRQSAEDRAHGRLTSLKPFKEQRPDMVLNLMGCMVGVKGSDELRRQYPYVDVFSPPSDPNPLVEHLIQSEAHAIETQDTSDRFAMMDGGFRLPVHEQGQLISAHVPVVYGCSHACTFCIIPFRRGIERSRDIGEIVAEVRALAAQGVREVTLLGQIVDRFGMDLQNSTDLTDLLRQVHEIDGIKRIRFLTSHPNWMTDDLLDAVQELSKVCPHIEVPVQAGDDEVLERMRRGYTADEYRRLIDRIRKRLPDGSIATDIIVGFPNETETQYMRTYDLLRELKLDVAHLARYSPRPRTVSSRRMADDVPEDEKMRRFQQLEDLQESVSSEINASYLEREVEVLVEKKRRGQWMGRTDTNKLVFFQTEANLRGELVRVKIEHTGPWSLRGTLVSESEQQNLVPIPVLN
ncbi:MAG: tRNA (N6-isopentenyl adenosine(37)-C2)-methylthiotransferase MiaB [Anaerolineales bacterium]